MRLLHKNQRGFTLIELLIAITIIGLITSGITMTIFQVISENARSTNHMLAVRQVQNAGYWISHDTQMAQSVDTDDDPVTIDEVELVILTWEEYSFDGDGDAHRVAYTIEDNKLQRSYSVNDGDSETAIVAELIVIDEIEFVGDKLTLTVTATVGGFKPASETRTYEITPRPD
jgi:prepilin-type N-terminal cleavage/methylation domain-containing protein